MFSFPLNNTMFLQPRSLPESAWTGHIPFAGWLVQAAKPSVFVELGTHRGGSFLAFCQAVKESGNPTNCYAIDTWQGDEHAGKYGEEIYLGLLDYQQRNYPEFSQLLRMKFDDAIDYFADRSIDLLHIDGFHTYEAVKHDFESWHGKLSNSAIVLFHDVGVRERNFGVWKYWAELKLQYPHFEFSHSHGLGVLLVGENQPDELLELSKVSAYSSEYVLINRLFGDLGKLITYFQDIGNLAREQGRIQAALNTAEAEILRQSQVITQANAELEKYSKIDYIRESLILKDNELTQLRVLLAAREAEIAKIHNSSSWLLTAPFRKLKKFFSQAKAPT